MQQRPHAESSIRATGCLKLALSFCFITGGACGFWLSSSPNKVNQAPSPIGQEPVSLTIGGAFGAGGILLLQGAGDIYRSFASPDKPPANQMMPLLQSTGV
ncbi:hypothetical protein QS306_05085 [Paraburkholderia bonniea]|uniref:hypothetical protein n=1 Tax=Paraburkholderia bonniea TaxID=2152891 RepID=UPI001292292E|nr:hypothetical protein [Paraburkholderia bonniea]WJF91030.1 hypothetical protein QS306_05085 [Paraburkholderia bonniea]WJF94344.1 hypothetical protein QS308_05090 [Paraburkholderia bonniea]